MTTLIGLRDRANVALRTYTFARVGGLLKMLGEDDCVQGKRGWVRLHEKGGKEHPMPCRHDLEADLDAYVTAAGIDTGFCCHTFRATRITTYLENGGQLELARRAWPITNPSALPGSMTGATMRRRPMKASEFRSDSCEFLCERP